MSWLNKKEQEKKEIPSLDEILERVKKTHDIGKDETILSLVVEVVSLRNKTQALEVQIKELQDKLKRISP